MTTQQQQPTGLQDDRLGTFASSQVVVRIVPDLPKGSPGNVAFPSLEKFNSRRFFSVSLGFVPLDCEGENEKAAIKFLKTVHVDCETTARGGRGPKLFEICTAQEAAEIIAEEQRRMLLSAGNGGAVMHAQLKAIVDSENQTSREQVAQLLAVQQTQLDQANATATATAAENLKLKEDMATVLARLAALEDIATAPKTITQVMTVDGAKIGAAATARVAEGEVELSSDLGAALRAEELAKQ